MDNNQNAHEDSLSEKYKNLFAEFEKHGQDISDGFKKFGGKEAFLQFIQDLEDDVAGDQVKIFKQAYSDNDIRRCVRNCYKYSQPQCHKNYLQE